MPHGTHGPISFVEALRRKATGRAESSHIDGEEDAYVQLHAMGEERGMGASTRELTRDPIVEERQTVVGKD